MEERVRTEFSGRDLTCAFEWCVTDHGRTVHPDDEDHRSAGWGCTVRVRDGRDAGGGADTILEVGVVQRDGDDAPWVVVETGAGIALTLAPDAARALGRRLISDRDIQSALASVDSAR